MGYSNGILESDIKGEGGVRGEQGLPGIGFKLTDDGDFDIDSKRLTDVGKPTENSDATTKAYVDDATGHNTGNFYHLRSSFTFYDSSDNLLTLSTDSITGLVTDYKHGYYKIPKSGDDSTFSTLDIKITNNLPQSTYSALFYLYGYRNGNLMRGVDLGPILFSVVGTDDYNILKYNDDDSTETTDHTKAIIWFTSNGQQGSIELGLRFFDKSITHFIILSRCVEGKVGLGFSSNIFNVPSTVGDVTLYFEDINMNSRKIKNLGGPTDDGDAINKKYLEDVALTIDGSNVMKGDLKMGQKKIIGLADPNGGGQAANKKYVDTENAKQDIAINDKASKSFVENEDLKLMDYLGNVVYSYAMDSYIHNNSNRFIFRDIDNEFFKTESGGFLKINVTGECILIYEDMFNGIGKLNINTTDDPDTYVDTYSIDMSYSKLTTQKIKHDFSINKPTYLSIASEGSLILDGQRADVQKFRLYVISDMTYISYSDNRYLKLDGGKPMTGGLKMGDNTITGLPQFVEDDSSQEASDAQRSYAINYGYYKDNRGKLVEELTKLIGTNLPKDGSEAMEGKLNMNNNAIDNVGGIKMTDDLNMNNNQLIKVGRIEMDDTDKGNSPINMNTSYIFGLPKPQRNDDAANKEYVDDEVKKKADEKYVNDQIKESEERSIRSLYKENVFKKVMDDGLFIEDDDDITKIGEVDKDFHLVNKKTYHFQIDYDSSIGYYSTRLGVNVVYLPIGFYIIAFEMFYSDKIDHNNITINCSSGTLQILSKSTKYSSDHSRSIFNFRKTVARPTDDELDIDIALKNKTGESYDAKTDIYVVVYGVEGLGTDVEPNIWDRVYYIDDNKIHFEAPIDMVNKDIENVNDLSINNELNMNNRQIKKLGDGNENSDGVNVKQLNEMETNVTKYVTDEFGKVNPVLSNNSDLIKFIYRNLIRNDSKLFLIKELYFPDSVDSRNQNNYSYQTNDDNKGDATFYLTFTHKATTSDSMVITLHWEGGIPTIHILISKDRVVVSKNLLINEPSLKSYNIPSYFKGKHLYLWIRIQNNVIKINFSGGSKTISTTHPDIQNKDENLSIIYVSDSPFTIQRGLITKNNYNQNSNAYKDVREYEISEGTYVHAS